MRPLELTMHDFLAWQSVTLDFRPLTCAVVTGPNGSGKSAIFDGLLVALFGQATKAGVRGMDDYIRMGAPGCQLEFLFEVEEKTYKVVRSRGRDKTALDLFRQKAGEGPVLVPEWEVLSEKLATATQAKIEALIRMDYGTFAASSMVLQGQADAFTQGMEDGDRRQLLGKILGLDAYGDLLKVSKEEAKFKAPVLDQLNAKLQELQAVETPDAIRVLMAEAKAKLTEAEKRLTEAQHQYGQAQARAAQVPLFEVQLRDASAFVKKWEGEISKTDAEILGAKKRVEELGRALAQKTKVGIAEADAAAYRPMLAEMDTAAQKYLALTSEVSKLTREKSSWEVETKTRAARLESQVMSAEKMAAEIETVPCAGCGLRDEGPCQDDCKYLKNAVLAHDSLPQIRAEMGSCQAQVCPVDAKLARIQAEAQALGYDPEAHNDLRDSLIALEPILALRSQLDGAERDAASAREKGADAELRKAAAARDLAVARKKLGEVEDRLQELAPAAQEMSTNKATVDAWKAAEATCRSDLARLEERVRGAERAQTDRQTTEQRIVDVRQEVQALDLLVQAFGPKGVPAAITKNAVPEIEALASSMLQRLTHGRFEVALLTERQGKSTGTEQDILKVAVYDQGVERSYTTYSGAERFMIDISLRCAISHFLANRAGAEIRLFVLDEGVSVCDPANREAMLGALMEISQDFGLLLVITHLEEIKDAFPQQIRVQPGPDGSTLEVVA